MKCKKADGTYTTVTWKLFYPACPKVNQLCSPFNGAWVAAITVCNLRLY